VQNFQLTSLRSEGPTMRPSDPQRGGNACKIQKTSLVNRWFELNVKKLFEMSEFIQPSRISPEQNFFNTGEKNTEYQPELASEIMKNGYPGLTPWSVSLNFLV
jgi:hypothetical protein